jgi:hypothetical protein
MFYITEMLATFSSLEVFVSAVTLGMFYCKYVASMITNQCNVYQKVIQELELPSCFEMTGEIQHETGFFLLLAAIVWFFVIYMLLTLIKRVLLPRGFHPGTIEWSERCGLLLKTSKES